MPGFVKTPEDEKKWARAKEIAKKQSPDDFYALANHIFHNMKKASSRQVNFDALLKPMAQILERAGFNRISRGLPHAMFEDKNGGQVSLYDQSVGWDAEAPVQVGIIAGVYGGARPEDDQEQKDRAAFKAATKALSRQYEIKGTSPFSKIVRSKSASQLWKALVRVAAANPGPVQDALVALLDKHRPRTAEGPMWGAFGLFGNGRVILRVTPDQNAAMQQQHALKREGAQRTGYSRKPMRKDPRGALRDLVSLFADDGAQRGLVQYV